MSTKNSSTLFLYGAIYGLAVIILEAIQLFITLPFFPLLFMVVHILVLYFFFSKNKAWKMSVKIGQGLLASLIGFGLYAVYYLVASYTFYKPILEKAKDEAINQIVNSGSDISKSDATNIFNLTSNPFLVLILKLIVTILASMIYTLILGSFLKEKEVD
jgi:hypothetical protein